MHLALMSGTFDMRRKSCAAASLRFAHDCAKNAFLLAESRRRSPSYFGDEVHLSAGYVEALHHLGHQNASSTCTLSEKVGRKHVPLSRKSTSEMPTWHPVVNKYVQKCTCPPEGDLSNKHYRRCSISTRARAAGFFPEFPGRLAKV